MPLTSDVWTRRLLLNSDPAWAELHHERQSLWDRYRSVIIFSFLNCTNSINNLLWMMIWVLNQRGPSKTFFLQSWLQTLCIAWCFSDFFKLWVCRLRKPRDWGDLVVRGIRTECFLLNNLQIYAVENVIEVDKSGLLQPLWRRRLGLCFFYLYCINKQTFILRHAQP